MKYSNSRLNAPGLRTFIATVHIATAVIGWKCSGKERTLQTTLLKQRSLCVNKILMCESSKLLFCC
jgi:hypothetical protein